MALDELIKRIVAFFQSIFNSAGSAGSAPPPLTAQGVIGEAIVKDAIAQGIPWLSTNGIKALTAQSKVETGNWSAWYFQGEQPDSVPPTYNLWNRHKGSGRGEWTGQTRYVSSGDPDLRIYADVFQSARDFNQLLNDPLYASAKAALERDDIEAYAQAVQDAGFAANNTSYAQSILNAYGDMA